MSLSIKEVPLNTRLAAKSDRGLSPESIRAKAKIVVKTYDSDNYIVGIRRGARYVKNLLVSNEEHGQTISEAQVEEHIRLLVLNGDFDKALIQDYDRTKKPATNPGEKRKRGRPRKNP